MLEVGGLIIKPWLPPRTMSSTDFAAECAKSAALLPATGAGTGGAAKFWVFQDDREHRKFHTYKSINVERTFRHRN